MPPPRQPALPIFMLVRDAFQTLWRQRDDALRLGLIPTLIYFGGLLLGTDALIAFGDYARAAGMEQVPPASVLGTILLTILIAMVGACLMVANWLRFMLLGPMSAIGIGVSIGPPQLSFTFATVVLFIVVLIAIVVASMPIALYLPALTQIGAVIASVAAVVVIARLSPFLVALAIAQPLSLRQAWAVSRGNGVPVALALFISAVPFWILTNIVISILGAIGFADIAPVATLFIISVFEIASAVVQASILAAAFRHMVGIKV